MDPQRASYEGKEFSFSGETRFGEGELTSRAQKNQLKNSEGQLQLEPLSTTSSPEASAEKWTTSLSKS